MTFEEQQAVIERASRARTEALHALIVSAGRWARRQGQRLAAAVSAARARAELYALSDRALKDIGLTRGQIDALFR